MSMTNSANSRREVTEATGDAPSTATPEAAPAVIILGARNHVAEHLEQLLTTDEHEQIIHEWRALMTPHTFARVLGERWRGLGELAQQTPAGLDLPELEFLGDMMMIESRPRQVRDSVTRVLRHYSPHRDAAARLRSAGAQHEPAPASHPFKRCSLPRRGAIIFGERARYRWWGDRLTDSESRRLDRVQPEQGREVYWTYRLALLLQPEYRNAQAGLGVRLEYSVQWSKGYPLWWDR